MVTRQSRETTIEEFIGKECDAIVGVARSTTPESPMFAFTRVDGAWYRFFIDEGVLFLESSSPPRESGDLTEDDVLIDLLPSGDPQRLTRVDFRDGTLEMATDRGLYLRLAEDAETSSMRIVRTVADAHR